MSQAVSFPTGAGALAPTSGAGGHNPDILTCLANLSADEVFTPPKLANAMLDMLPAELWSNPKATFLDPCTKSGVFLREIARRLNAGLASQMPDDQKRIDPTLAASLRHSLSPRLLTSSPRRAPISLPANKTFTPEPPEAPEPHSGASEAIDARNAFRKIALYRQRRTA